MSAKRILLTGGAGFIGSNTARYFSKRNWEVVVADNLSRPNVDKNLEWLQQDVRFDFHKVDVRNYAAVEQLFKNQRFNAVIHLAAQVAVTTSVTDPRLDFEVNAAGTFNVLDAIRRHCPDTVFIFASTNKVYGKVEGAAIAHQANRYVYTNRPRGIDEHEPLDFLSPYGCSKGAADQYALDFARIYGIPATTFRQSCIYGPRQFGIEDQGWVAWFAIAAKLGRPITIYGDGMQVRDVLYIDDLVKAYEAAVLAPDKIAGQAFNIGGGPANILSLLDLVEILERNLEIKISPKWGDWRPGDQRVYISNIEKLSQVLGWVPEVPSKKGVERLADWVDEHRHEFS